ncbi:PEP-CTERM sorting domain-containing protein [Planctomycetota bacterium]
MARKSGWCRLAGRLVVALVFVAGSMAQAVLLDDFDTSPWPNPAATAAQGNTAPGPALTGGGPTGQYLRLINTVNGQSNHYAYDLTDAGAYSTINASFDFRASGSADPADGFGFMLLPTSVYGNTGVGPGGYFESEEPNIAGVLAIGVDLYPTGSGVNDVSLHVNGTERRNVTLNPATLDLDAGVFHRANVTVAQVPGGSNVTLQLTADINGGASPTLTPILNEFIPNLYAYENRVQFSGRTGGANVDVDLDNINVAWSGPTAPPPTISATTLVQDFDSAGTTDYVLTQGQNPPAPVVQAGGPTGNYLRLINDGAGSQANRIGFDRAPDGGVSPSTKLTFDFRGFDSPPQPTAADGFSMVLLPTSAHGVSGAGPSFTAEEPNVAGALGIGFDLWQDINEVSVHYNGGVIATNNIPIGQIDLDAGAFHRAEVVAQHVAGGSNVTVTLTPDVHGSPGTPVTVFSNLFVPGMLPYDYRAMFAGRTGGATMDVDLDNISTDADHTPPTTQVLQRFEGGGSFYEGYLFGVNGPPSVVPGPAIMTGGPTGNFLRLVNDGVANNRNSLTFDQTPDFMVPRYDVTAEFDFRATSQGDAADGFALLFLPTDTYGPSGPGVDWTTTAIGAEEPNVAGVVAIGFDLHPAASVNDVSLHFGSELTNVTLTGIDLDSGLWHHARVEMDKVAGGTNVSLFLTPDIHGAPGAEFQAFSELIPGLDPYAFRLEFAARTGGLDVSIDLDNIDVRLPEPATLSLLALGGLGLLARRRRKS